MKAPTSLTLVVKQDDVNRGPQHDLDEKGIAKTAREEKKRARDAKLAAEKHKRRERPYRAAYAGREARAGTGSVGRHRSGEAEGGRQPGGSRFLRRLAQWAI